MTCAAIVFLMNFSQDSFDASGILPKPAEAAVSAGVELDGAAGAAEAAVSGVLSSRIAFSTSATRQWIDS